MVANVSVKSFISRAHKIELEEFMMSYLRKLNLVFPALLTRQRTRCELSEKLSRSEIENIIEDAMKFAESEAESVGMKVNEIRL